MSLPARNRRPRLLRKDRRSSGARSIPALYGALTAGLVAVVMVVASVVTPATPPSIAELSPSARDRIEEARAEQGIGSGRGGSGNCAPGDLACARSQAKGSVRDNGAGVAPPVEVAAGRRCFGDPPRQTEDPHSPPCVFEIFKGDNGGATAPGVSATEIRVAFPIPGGDELAKDVARALTGHFNRRYEFYGRRIVPVFVEYPFFGPGDSSDNRAVAEDLVAARPFAVGSGFVFATNTIVHRRLADARVISVVRMPPAFDSDQVVDGLTWLVEPPLDVRLRAGAAFVCRALNGRPARHAGAEFSNTSTPRRLAIVVLGEESGVRPDPRPLAEGLDACGADFDVFDIPLYASDQERRALMLQLKGDRFTTVLQVAAEMRLPIYRSATNVGYFPEWMHLGEFGPHLETQWGGSFGRPYTAGQGDHAFGLTPEVRVRPAAEIPAMWALREGDPSVSAPEYVVDWYYQPLLVIASGVQGAGPNLTPETFARALWTTQFPNPNAGAPPYWQQGIGFGPGDPVFHDDYSIWWWNDNASPQTSGSNRGSFCYLNRGARFTPDSFPANADSLLFSTSEPCR